MDVALAYSAAALAAVAYGLSSLWLSQGADDVRSRSYLAGLIFQGAGFALAFVARTEAPLLLVQSAVTASVAVTALLGAWTGRWRLDGRDLAAVAAVVIGVTMIGAAAEPGPARPMPAAALVVCLMLVVALPAAVRTSASANALGAMAGLCYGASAFSARALAAQWPPSGGAGFTAGQVALLIGGVLAGQILLTLAFRRAHERGPDQADRPAASAAVTGPVSMVYLASTVLPALAGWLWLGDRLREHRGVPALIGLGVALGGSMVLAGREDHRHEQHPRHTDAANPTDARG